MGPFASLHLHVAVAALSLFSATLLGSRAAAETVSQRWVQQYDGPAQKEDGVAAVAADAAGDIVVVGYSVGEFRQDGLNSIRKTDFRTAKYSGADGALLWEQRHRGVGDTFNQGRAVIVDPQGNVIVTGQSDGGLFGTGADIYTAKYAGSDGRLLWERRYNHATNRGDVANALAIDADGNVIITGSTTTNASAGRTDYYTAKYSGADGAILWEKLYNGPAGRSDQGLRVAVDQAGNAVVTGTSEAITLLNDICTLKYARNDGSLLWERRYDGPDGPSGDDSTDAPGDLAVDASGDVAITGFSHAGGGGTPFYTAKYAGADGHIVWEKRVAAGEAAVGTDAGGNVFVGGRIFVPKAGDGSQADFYVAKYASSNGALLWEKTYGGPAAGDDGARDLQVDSAGNVVVTGRVTLSESPFQFHAYTAKYAGGDGALLWEQTYGGGPDGSNDAGERLTLTPDGGVGVVGDTVSNNPSDWLIIKYALGTAPPPPPPVEPYLWVAGRDFVSNEKPDSAKEIAAANPTVPQWSYGYRSSVAGTEFTLFPPSSHTNADRGRDAVEGWSAGQGVVVVNTGPEPVQYFAGTVPFKPLFRDQILVRRTSTVFMPVVRWTAPSAGSYRIIAKWVDLNPHNNGGAAHVVINGQQVFGRQQSGTFIGQEWPDEGNAAMPAQTFALEAGATIDFVLSTRAGDSNTDDTAFSAAIARVPTVTIAAPASAPAGADQPPTATVAAGQEVNVSVSVASKLPITAVRLLVDGQPAPLPPDRQAPYEFTLPSFEGGTHYLTAIAQDSTGAQGVSEQIRLLVNRTGAAAARATGEKGTERAALAASGGATFRCTQSGLWQDANTWGGQGVPGRNDDAIIPAGFEVDLAGTRVDIGNLEVAGRLVAATGGFRTPLFIYGTMQMSGYVRGPAILIQTGGRFVTVGGRVRFENTHLFNYGETIVGEKGGISSDDASELSTFGTVNILRAQGTNRPTVAAFHGIQIAGGQVLIGPFAQLVAAGAGNLIGQDGGSLVGHDGSSLIGQDGSTLIGQDGSTLIGQDGSTLIGADGGRLIGLDGSTLIGQDGSTLIGQDGGSLIGQDGGSFQTASAAVSDAKGSERVAREFTGGLGGIRFNGGMVRGIINLIGNVTNGGAFFSPGNSPGRMRVFGDYTQESGGTLVLEVRGTQTEPLQFDQLEIGGTAILGGKLIVNAIDGFNPQPGDVFTPLTYSSVIGSFASVSSNAQISLGAEGMTMQVAGPNPPAPKALNIATRMRVETGDNVLIAGFIVTGSQPKKVLIRGIGPSLPVAGALADPTLDLDGGAFFNDDWRSDQRGEIEATTIPPSSDLESAIVATLEPGAHTAVLRGKNNGTGVGLVEVYDLESGTPAQLANISTRGQVQTGDNVMIGGFIIAGDYPAKVLLRAIGPSLPVEGALQDPTLELVDGQGNTITNDDWRETQEAEIIGTTVPPTNDNEAAIVATLVPGNYTAVVRGKDDTVGVALVEGYNLQ